MKKKLLAMLVLTMALTASAGLSGCFDAANSSSNNDSINSESSIPEEDSSSNDDSSSQTPVVATFTVAFNSDGGSAVDTQDVDEGQTVSEPSVPTKMGYDFAGWKLNGSAYDFSTPITGDIQLIASWNPKTDTAYKFEVYAEELDGTYNHFITYDRTGTTDANVALGEDDLALIPTGFEFDSDNEGNVVSGKVEADGSLVLKAYINRISIDIKYYDDNGELLYTEGVKYEGSATYTEVPTKEQDAQGFYVFANWVTEQSGSTVADLTNVVKETLVYASYRVKNVLITGAPASSWQDPYEVVDSSDFAYGTEEYSTKVGFKAGSKYASLIANFSNTKDVGYVDFFIKNTTGKELDIFTDMSLEETGGAVTKISADTEWQFVRLAVNATSGSSKINLRGAGESVVNENEVVNVYLSNVIASEKTTVITGFKGAWVDPAVVCPSIDYTYGTENVSTKIGFKAGYKYANLNAKLINVNNTAYIEFYIKNTTGKALEIYTDKSLEENGGVTSISADSEWQFISLAVERGTETQKICLRGKGESVINESEVAYVYISKVLEVEAKTTISGLESGKWQEPASVTSSTDYVYGTEAESTKIGFKAEYKYASFYVTLVEAGATHIEFYIKNTTGKALEIFTDQSLSENGGAPYSISADAEWKLIRLAINTTTNKQKIYLRGAGETVVTASEVAYVYISNVTEA